MMRNWLVALLCLTTCLFSSLALASERGTKEDALKIARLVQQFHAEFGLDATIDAVMEKSNPDFFFKDIYPFIGSLKGVNLAHGEKPHLQGVDLINLKDPDGKLFIQEMVRVAVEDGEGWMSYTWPLPGTNTFAPKETYIIRLGDNSMVGVGAYTK